ncbi:MAG TPA: nucleotidyltransferase family protein [Allocoleopsis sp.]
MHTTLSLPSDVERRPEIELLLCCSRTRLDSQRTQLLSILVQEEIDWTYLIQIALRQGVMPLLYFNLNTTCPDAVPKTVLEQLRNHFQSNALNSLFLASELLKLLNLFNENAIPTIPFKGPVLTAEVYGNLTLRQFCDLDILVREQDFLKARELLILEGYQPLYEFDWEQSFAQSQSGIHVDLHQGLTSRYFPVHFDFDRCWQRLESVSLAGTTVMNLSAEDLLIILCVQVAKDCWYERDQLIKICDIAELINAHQSLDWKDVLEQAHLLGCKRMLFLSLLLAHELLDTALPQTVLLELQANSAVMSLAVKIRDRFFQNTYIPPDTIESPLKRLLRSAIFNFRIRERWQDKLPYIFFLLKSAIIPNANDCELVSLPASLSCLYYLLKPVRLVEKYGWKPLQNLLKRLHFPFLA